MPRRLPSVLALIACAIGCNSAPQIDRQALARILDLQDRRVPAVAELSEFLRAPTRWTRRFAARALGVLARPEAAPALASALERDPDAEVRREAVAALGRCRPDHPALATACADDDPEVRRLAVQALAGEASATALRAALRDRDPQVRAAAAARLGRTAAAQAGEADATVAALLDAWHPEVDPIAQFGLLSALTLSGRPGLASLFAAAAASPRARPELTRAALAALETAAQQDTPTRTSLREGLTAATARRLLAHPDVGVSRAATHTLAALGQPRDLRAADADQQALRDLLARAIHSSQIVAIGRAVAALAPAEPQLDVWCQTFAMGANRGEASQRAAHLRALAACAPDRAAEVAMRLQEAPQIWLRAAATEVLAARGGELVWSASPSLGRHPLLAAAALRGLAQARGAPPLLLALRQAEPSLIDLAPDLLAPALRNGLGPAYLLTLAQAAPDEVTRALAGLAAWHTTGQDDASAGMLAVLRQDPSPWLARTWPGAAPGAAPWPVSTTRDAFAPYVGTVCQLLGQTLHVELRTTRGKVALALDPAAAPLHVAALLRDLEASGTWRGMVVRSTAERVHIGNPLAPRPDAEHVLRREPHRRTSLAPGLVGFAPLPLADLDGPELFITRLGTLDGVSNCTVVGQVVDGMGTVESLEDGDRILHISWRSAPN